MQGSYSKVNFVNGRLVAFLEKVILFMVEVSTDSSGGLGYYSMIGSTGSVTFCAPSFSTVSASSESSIA